MKKWISFIMILFLAFIFVGCGEDPNPDKPVGPVDTVKPTEIVVTGIEEGQELEANQSITLQVKVLPDDATNKKYRIVSSNPATLKVQDDTITALSAGEVVLTITAVGDTSVKKTFNLKVKGEEAAPVEPTEITLTAEKNEVEVSRVLTLNVEVKPENATKTVKWSSSDESIAKVNNGLVIGVAEGETTITATSTLNEEIKAEFKVKVVPNQSTPVEKVDPASIILEISGKEIEVGYKLTARATVYPNGADQNVVWKIKDPEIASIDENGIITGLKAGQTVVTVYCESNFSIKDNVKITVKDSSEPETYPDLKGYKIVLMNAVSALSDIDPFLDGYTANDKMYKQQAWKEIKEIYNCDISVEAYPDEAPWGEARIAWINSQAEQGNSKADFLTISTAWISMTAGVGSGHNAIEYYEKYGKEQMESILKQASTYKGGLYGLSTGPNETKNYVDLGLYYNLAWVEKLKLESPAKLFNEGKWTYSTFVKWANDCQALLNDGEYALAGHFYYYWLGMSNAAGVKVADTATATVTLNNARQIEAAQVLQGLVASGSLATTSNFMENKTGEFGKGTAVMTAGSWWFMKAANRWPSDMWGEDTRYGYVPFPYPDDMSKEQSRIGEYGTTMLLFAAGRDSVHPAGVTYEMIYRAMLDAYLRSAKYYSEEPTYDADAIKYNEISSKVDDPESVEAALWWNNSNCMYDGSHDFFVRIADCKLKDAIITIVKDGKDYEQAMNSIENIYVNAFYEKYS